MKIQNEEKDYYTNQHITYSCQYHVVFCTKYRRKVLNDEVKNRLETLFQDIAKEYEFTIMRMEVSPDGVHLIIDCNPRFGVMNCVIKLKSITSRTLREEFPHLKSRIPTLWTRNAFISSVGDLYIDNVHKFIENQKTV